MRISNATILKLRNADINYRFYTWSGVIFIYSLLCWPLLNSIAMISMAAWWLLFTHARLPEKSPEKLFFWSSVALFIIPLIGCIYSENMADAIGKLRIKLPLLLIPVVYGTTKIIDRKMLDLFRIHFLIATSSACLISLLTLILSYLTMGESVMEDNTRVFIFKGGYPYLIGLFSLLSIMIAFGRLRTAKSTGRILLISAILFLSFYILLLSIRVVVACWAIAMLVCIFSEIRNRLLRILLGASIICSVVAAVIVIPTFNRQFNEIISLKDNTIPLDQDASQGRSWGGGAIRIAILQSTKELRENHWLTGVGTGDVQDSLQQAYRNHLFYFASEYNRYNSHNQYLENMIGTGIISTLNLVICILLPLFFFTSGIYRPDYIVFLVSFAIICFTEVILDTSKGVAWYSFFSSIFAFSNNNSTSTDKFQDHD